jgi:hypothetical protein
VGHPADVPGLCVPPAGDREPIAVQEAIITMRTAGTGENEHHEFVIHPSAMPPGSAVYLSNVNILGTPYKRAAAFTIWILRQDRLPACTG